MVEPSWTSFRPGTGSWWVVAHRGASSRRRENSPEAFEAAIASGAAAIETDVRRTADGVFVCHHDETLRRTAGSDREIRSLSFSELKQLAPAQAILLTDVFEAVRGRCNMLLDLKLRAADDLAALATLLGQLSLDETIAAGVRSLPTQAALRELRPELVQLGLLEELADTPGFVAGGGRWVRLWEQHANEARVAAIHALGVPVLVMAGGSGTGREVGEIGLGGVRGLHRLGADGVMLNDPDVGTAAVEGR